jgi:hypothetical protein
MSLIEPTLESKNHTDLALRFERFARSRDTAELWPGLTERARVAAARELERVVRAVLAGNANVSIDCDTHEPYAIAIAAYTTGMGPLLGRWAEVGIVDASLPVHQRFAQHLQHARRRAERIERELLPALDALIAAGIAPVMLKGYHTARAYFEEPALRRMSDVDVLVAAQEVPIAEAALTSVGFRPTSEADRPYKRDWMAATVEDRVWSVELDDERTKWTLELHASLDRLFHHGAVARLDSERSDTVAFDVQGRRVLALAPAVLLLTLAAHCSHELHNSRLLRLVEIVRLIRAELAAGGLEWDALLEVMRRTGTAAYVYPAFHLAEDLAPGTIDAKVLAVCARQSTWAARHTVSRLAPAGGSPDQRGLIRQLMWTRGPVALAERVLRAIWPASLRRPRDVIPAWRVRLRRVRAGLVTLRAPDERGG